MTNAQTSYNGLVFGETYLPIEIVTKILLEDASKENLYSYSQVCQSWRAIVISHLLRNARFCHGENLAKRFQGYFNDNRTLICSTSTDDSDRYVEEEWTTMITTSNFAHRYMEGGDSLDVSSNSPPWEREKSRTLFV